MVTGTSSAPGNVAAQRTLMPSIHRLAQRVGVSVEAATLIAQLAALGAQEVRS
jgi:hypothetical protein